MEKYIQIESTFACKEEAGKIAELMLDAKLTACAKISLIDSFYHWKCKKCESEEFLLTLITKTELYGKCEEFIKANHPYETPMILATKISHGSQDYFDWVENSLAAAQEATDN